MNELPIPGLEFMEQVIIVREPRRRTPTVITDEQLTDRGIMNAARRGVFPIYEHRTASGHTLYRASEHALTFIDQYVGDQNIPTHRKPERTGFLKGNPSQFFRGLPALFTADIRKGPYHESIKFHPDKPPPRSILINGDSHIRNFGAFRGPDGQVVFGSNDHDQSGYGSPEEDVARLATSVVLQAQELGMTEEQQYELAIKTVDGYTDEIREIAEHGVRSPYLTIEELKARSKKADRGTDLVYQLLSGTKKRQARFYKRYVVHTDEGWRLAVDPDRKGNNPPAKGYHKKLWPVTDEEVAWIQAVSNEAIERPAGGITFPLQIVHAAERRFSGGSTIGLPRSDGLFQVDDPSKPPIDLEIKQIIPCAPVVLSGDPGLADGRGVLNRQLEAEQNFNELTGVAVLENATYLVREREPEKDSVDFEDPDISFDQLLQYARDCATVRARQHARTPEQAKNLAMWIGKKNEDEEAEERVGAFAVTYTIQTNTDYAAYSNVS